MNPVTLFSPQFPTTSEPVDLALAVTLQNPDKVRHCIDQGANPFCKDPKTGNTPFHIAAGHSDGKVLRELGRFIRDDSRLELKNDKYETALFIAAEAGNLEGCQVLLDLGALPNTVCGKIGARPLHAASVQGHAAIIELLLNSTPVDAKTYNGYTAFYLACKEGKIDAARALLARGASPMMAHGRSKWTALHIAAFEGHANILRLFEGWSEDIDVRTKDGATAFYLACQEGRLETACELLLLGADPLIEREESRTALHIAARNGQNEIIDLLRYNPDLLDARNPESETPLFITCRKGHHVATKLLLDAGANANVTVGHYKETPLHVAADYGHADTIRRFGGRAVVVDAQDTEGCTPFELSCQSGYLDVALELIAIGANMAQLNPKTGEIGLHGAAYRGHANIIRVYSRRRDLLDLTNSKGAASLHIAASNGHAEFVRVMLQSGASIRLLPDCNLSYSREIIDIFIAHQKEKLNSSRLAVDMIDALIDQEFIISSFSRTLKIEAQALQKVMDRSPYIPLEAHDRAYANLPVHAKLDISKLYNHKECRSVIERLAPIDVDIPACTDPMSTTIISQLLKALEQEVPVAKVSEGLKSLIVQRYKQARKIQDATYKNPPSSKHEPYPLTDAQFFETGIYELLTKRYGLKDEEISAKKCINTGLLTGYDLNVLGIDNGFYHEDRATLQASLARRIEALEVWQRLHRDHYDQIEYVLQQLITIKDRLSNIDPIDDLTASFASLTLSDRGLHELDRDSALILINMFITKKEAVIVKRLSRTNTTSLAEYAAKHHSFVPQYV